MQAEVHPDESVLNEYLDQALEAEQVAALQAHLASCAACAARLEGLRQVFLALEALPAVALAHDLAPGVVAALRRSSLRQRLAEIPATLRLLFVAQVLLGAALLLFSWPLVAQDWLGWETTWQQEIRAAIETLAQQGLTRWLATWQTAQQYFAQGLDTWHEWSRQPAWAQVSQLELVILLVAAVCAWLAANGYLLHPHRLGNHLSLFKRRQP